MEHGRSTTEASLSRKMSVNEIIFELSNFFPANLNDLQNKVTFTISKLKGDPDKLKRIFRGVTDPLTFRQQEMPQLLICHVPLQLYLLQ